MNKTIDWMTAGTIQWKTVGTLTGVEGLGTIPGAEDSRHDTWSGGLQVIYQEWRTLGKIPGAEGSNYVTLSG